MIFKSFISKALLCQKLVVNIQIRNHSWRILFFGSDSFSLHSLKELHSYWEQMNIGVLDVVTTTSTLKAKTNVVKKYADKNNIRVFSWPLDLDKTETVYDIGVVVSFGHLIPKRIINYFPFGMINVHASLLPRWRGASPIVYSILSGDTVSGVTIMKINPHHFDTGNIILQRSCSVGLDELMPSLYERLGHLGATCLLECISTLPQSLENSLPQSNEEATYAPRINKDIAIVRWEEKTSLEVYNLYRALFSIFDLRTSWHGVTVKLKKVKLTPEVINYCSKPARVEWHRTSKQLCVGCKSGIIFIDELCIGGKSLRGIDFYNGYLTKRPPTDWYFA